MRHACANPSLPETINTDRESSSANAVSNAQRAWANTTNTCIPDELFVAVARRTIAASDAVQRAGSGYQRTAGL
jgi:hypothetical protein